MMREKHAEGTALGNEATTHRFIQYFQKLFNVLNAKDVSNENN
jgi:hypothetical protein